MAETVPVTELSAFSSPRRHQRSGLKLGMSWRALRCIGFRRFDLTAARMSRPCWESGSKGLCTSVPDRTSEKQRTSSRNCHCILTTGQSTLDGLDLVIEGTAESVNDHAELGRVANTYESKYGPHFVAPDGNWSGLGDAIRRAEVLVFRVALETGFGFGKGGSVKHAGAFRYCRQLEKRAQGRGFNGQAIEPANRTGLGLMARAGTPGRARRRDNCRTEDAPANGGAVKTAGPTTWHGLCRG